MSTNDFSLDLSAEEIAPYDYGFEAGIGIRIPTYTLSSKSNISLKLSYMYGLANTYPNDYENYSSDELSLNLLKDGGKRYVRGFQLTIAYELSIEKKTITHFTAGGNGKKTYKKFLVH